MNNGNFLNSLQSYLEKVKTLFINNREQLINFSIYLFKALLLMVFIYLIASKFAVSRFWIVVLGVFLFSIPIFICGIYTHTVHKISRFKVDPIVQTIYHRV
jgi:hypothetical protein